MTRPVLVALSLGVAGAGAWAVLALTGDQVMPSYLAGWLCWMALPLGALPLVMLLELLGVRGWAVLPPLRRMLLLLPVGALLAAPLALGAGPLLDQASAASPWLAPWWLLVRLVTMLAIWSVLALVFCRAPRRAPRRGWAVLGLMLHLVMGSVAAVDWVMALDPGLGSSEFGLLLIVAQMGAALCFAVLALAVSQQGGLLPEELPPLMLAFVGAWLFLHFVQFLVVWSANLPAEVAWYQRRALGLGTPAIWFGFVAAVVAILGLLPYQVARRPAVMASTAAMLLLVHAAEMLWLVTPAWRGAFVIAAPDLAAVLGLCGIAVALLLLAGIGGADRKSYAGA